MCKHTKFIPAKNSLFVRKLSTGVCTQIGYEIKGNTKRVLMNKKIP